MPSPVHLRPSSSAREEGFALIGLVVAIFIILLGLSVAAPTVARALRRDRELETMHRARQYDRAIQLYYKKAGSYPGSLDQLEKSNNIRYLRQKYDNPMVGKPDWRLIKVGENKTTVKGFFGQPLGGIAGSGLGSAAGIASAGGTGTPIGSDSTGFGQASAFNNSSPGAGSPSGSSSGLGGGNSSPASGTMGSGGGTGTGFGSGSGIGGQSGTGLSGSAGPFIGVGLPGEGAAIIVVNEQTTYPTWEFLYDPRIEQLKAKVNILGGGMSSGSPSGLGSAGSMTSGSSPSSTNTSPSSTPSTSSPGSATPSTGP